MRLLGIESTCDETAAAVVEDGRRVIASVVANQNDLHARFRGVVPEIASRAHIENILPVLSQTLSDAKISLGDVDAIAVAHRPGLIGSLLIGVTAAKTLAWAAKKPLVGVDHVHAHLYSVCLDSDISIAFPAVGLVCSGGHTALYRVDDFLTISLIGTTLDDAVGEAYDKVAAMLGLGYPGGPILDALAEKGDPRAIAFPRSRMERTSLDFSFSGLKTAVLYHVRGHKGREKSAADLSQAELADVAASFQAACVDVLVDKIRRAARQIDARSILIGGGVSANRGLRTAMANFHLPVHFPHLRYCTDNAAMIAGLASTLLDAGRISNLGLDAIPQSDFNLNPAN